ncbi:MAG: hypothetical protein RSD40_00365 [Bacilli bacterium]
MKVNQKLAFLLFPSFFYSQVGINTVTPQKTFHINGSLQVVKELSVGGTENTEGTAGLDGQLLTSTGSNTAPEWRTPNSVKGTVASAHYIQGTSAATITQGTAGDVPGVIVTIAVPAGKIQTVLITVTGYASADSGTEAQGVFALLHNGTKISSAYSSMISGKDLVRLPIPATLLKSIELPEGTHIFKVQYSSWFGNCVVNRNPSNYGGYNGDSESMLTKMQVLVYNN